MTFMITRCPSTFSGVVLLCFLVASAPGAYAFALPFGMAGISPASEGMTEAGEKRPHLRHDLRIAQASRLLNELTTSRLLEDLERERVRLEQELQRLERLRLQRLRALQGSQGTEGAGRQQFQPSQFSDQNYQREQHRRQQFKHQQYQGQTFKRQ